MQNENPGQFYVDKITSIHQGPGLRAVCSWMCVVIGSLVLRNAEFAKGRLGNEIFVQSKSTEAGAWLGA